MPKIFATVFRADINGLRAWAVMAVVLFHLYPGAISGGFVGVDIFFVISGLLMTSIIMRGLNSGNFSFIEFCLARTRRIFPALWGLITVLLVLGWFWLPTSEYQDLGSQTASALLFLSNIHFWRTAGYFDGAASDKPLLHTWSLSAEWQFYMLLPLFLVLLWKLRPEEKTVFVGMIFLFISSLVVSAIATPWKPTPAYYLLPTRGWEMAAGGIVFFLSQRVVLSKNSRRVCQWLAWPILVASMMFFSGEYPWPGVWALVPVVATMLLLLANNNDSLLVANPLAQWLGDRSYSIYLWHWPLVVALHFFGVNEDLVWIITALLGALVLGDLSYRLIENRARSAFGNMNRSMQIFVNGGALVAIGVAAISVSLINFEGRMPADVELADSARLDKNPRRTECFIQGSEGSTGCTFGDYEELGAVVIGDSHADMVINAMSESAQAYNKSVLMYGLSMCPTIEGIIENGGDRSENTCQDFNRWVFKQLDTVSSEIPVVLISRTSIYFMGADDIGRPNGDLPYYLTSKPEAIGIEAVREQLRESLIDTACKLAEKRQVYLMRPVPEFVDDVPRLVARQLVFQQESSNITLPINEYYEKNSFVWSIQNDALQECGVGILNPLPYLCDNEVCNGSIAGKPLYLDNDHLNEYGSRYLTPMFEPVFNSRTGKTYTSSEQVEEKLLKG